MQGLMTRAAHSGGQCVVAGPGLIGTDQNSAVTVHKGKEFGEGVVFTHVVTLC